jgi:indolepyruvate ferredoxin oxidoreductase
VVVNSDVVPTAQFQTNQKIDFNQAAMLNTLRKHAGKAFTHEVDATALTLRLMGDSIGTNIFMLGFAAQKGLLPVSLAALEEAIRLNGVAVAANLETLNWGRLAAHDLAAVLEAASSGSTRAAPVILSQTLDEVIARREKLLTDWQDAAYAREYRGFVDKVRQLEGAALPGSAVLTEAVARVLAKLMAYKDEFEVARLYSNGDFMRRLQSEFEGDFKLKVHMAPPLVAPRNSKGELVKRPFRGGLMLPLFGWMTRFKGLRKTPLNVFGYTAERRMERELIGQYRALAERVLSRVSAHNATQALELLKLYDGIKGYGHVKERNVAAVRQQEAVLLAKYESQGAEVLVALPTLPKAAAHAVDAGTLAPVRKVL